MMITAKPAIPRIITMDCGHGKFSCPNSGAAPDSKFPQENEGHNLTEGSTNQAKENIPTSHTAAVRATMR
jgi:hypothetical protein